ARQEAGLDDDDGRPLRCQQGIQFSPRRLESREAHFARALGEHAGDALVFAEVDGENAGRGRGDRDRVHGASLRWGNVGFGNLRTFRLPLPPRLAWILSARRDIPTWTSS